MTSGIFWAPLWAFYLCETFTSGYRTSSELGAVFFVIFIISGKHRLIKSMGIVKNSFLHYRRYAFCQSDVSAAVAADEALPVPAHGPEKTQIAIFYITCRPVPLKGARPLGTMRNRPLSGREGHTE